MRFTTKAVLWGASSAVILLAEALLVLRPSVVESAIRKHPQIVPILLFQLLIMIAVTLLATGQRASRGSLIMVLNGVSIILLLYLAYLVGAF